ncbi:MAG: nitroreductase family protein [Actinomycetota bacterium]
MTDTSSTPFDVAEADRLLSTTRAVRKRLDFDRPVPDQVLLDCIDIAEQAPSGGNYASRRWLVVKDQGLKDEMAALYRRSAAPLQAMRDQISDGGGAKPATWSSSAHLVEHFADAPALVIAAVWGEHDGSGRPGLFDSVIQAAWSFNVALRARGLGSAWTTMLNGNVAELAELLKIPNGVTTIVTFPVAYTMGTDFSPATRRAANEITYFDRWGFTRQTPSEDDTDRIVWGPGIVAETDVAVPPVALWPLISDITMSERFSEEVTAVSWASDERGLGAVFTGSNKIGDFEWSVPCHVTAYEENRIFEWGSVDADDPGARWRLEIEPLGPNSRLRFSCVIGPNNNGTASRAQADADREAEVLNGRRAMVLANMERTIAGIKELAEAG